MSFARGIPREYIANKKFDKSKLFHLTLKKTIYLPALKIMFPGKILFIATTLTLNGGGQEKTFGSNPDAIYRKLAKPLLPRSILG